MRTIERTPLRGYPWVALSSFGEINVQTSVNHNVVGLVRSHLSSEIYTEAQSALGYFKFWGEEPLVDSGLENLASQRRLAP